LCVRTKNVQRTANAIDSSQHTMPMRKRTAYTLLAVFAFLCALGVAIYLRQKAPPEAARLLPESDAIVYVNLKPLRLATHFDQNPISPNSYKDFIDATGILPERDIDSAAFALHRMGNPKGPNGPVGFSEVFEGRFDRGRLSAYLAAHAIAQEDYAGRTIYSLPSEGRTVRVALLGYDMVAASNMPTTEQIHSILDRQRAAASPFAGSSLLNARFADVPAFSSAWAVGHIGLPFSTEGRISVLGLELPLPADTTFVASLRFTTVLHLRIDEITENQDDAARSARALNDLLALARAIQRTQQPEPRTPEDRALRQFADSIVIEPHKDRATLSATVPVETLRQLGENVP
jgi:hypothetical protein